MKPGAVVDLGGLDYRSAHARQLALVDERKVGAGVDTLFYVEHPHVITLGRSRQAEANVLAADDVEVIAIERGGDATYHGPGQLVAYPVIALVEGERDLHKFLRKLEQAMMDTLATFDIEAGRVQGKTGVWVAVATRAPRKIASIGIACRRWVTFHGLALNVNTDLSYFHRINPCGFDASIMTSMQKELGRPVDMAAVKTQLATDLGTQLQRNFQQSSGV